MKFTSNKTKLKTAVRKGKVYYHCLIREKLVLKTPEESVRQQLVFHLLHHLSVPKENIWIEGSLSTIFPDTVSKRRVDLMIFVDTLKPEGTYRDIIALFECKKSKKMLDDSTIDQLYDYQLELGAQYCMITNGNDSLIFFINLKNNRIEVLNTLPNFQHMVAANNKSVLKTAYIDKNGDFLPLEPAVKAKTP